MRLLDAARFPSRSREGELAAGDAHGGAGPQVDGIQERNASDGLPVEGQGNLGTPGDHTDGTGAGQVASGSHQGVAVSDSGLQVTVAAAFDTAWLSSAFAQRPIDGPHQKILLENSTRR